MSLYTSQLTITMASAMTLVLLIWLAAGPRAAGFLREVLTQMRKDLGWFSLLARVALVLALNTLELRVEPLMNAHVHTDFTPRIARVGTGLLLGLQRLESVPLTQVLTFAYVVLFPVLGISSLLIYIRNGDRQSLKRLAIGIAVNYLAALPFYLFFPVSEAWAGHAGVQFLIPKVFPAFETLYRPLSGLDNCFPSLHTSLALTFAWIGWRSGDRRLATVLTAGAALVVLATLYLGIHWVLDAAAGAVLSLAAGGCLPVVLHSLTELTGRAVQAKPAPVMLVSRSR